MHKDITLLDGVEHNKKYPGSFWIPYQKEKDSLKVGDTVKLVFQHPIQTERMWVIITKIDGDKLEGTLDNDPAFIPNLKYKDIIEFEKRHIINIYDGS